MTDADKGIIKALECCYGGINEDCENCPYRATCGDIDVVESVLDLIKRQKAENDNLFLTLSGVMHFVDKWLDGDELNKDEVNRAIAMRDKTLEITGRQAEQIEALISGQETLQKCIAEKDADISQLEYDIELLNQEKIVVQLEAITEFAEILKDRVRYIHNEHLDVEWEIDDLLKIWRDTHSIL